MNPNESIALIRKILVALDPLTPEQITRAGLRQSFSSCCERASLLCKQFAGLEEEEAKLQTFRNVLTGPEHQNATHALRLFKPYLADSGLLYCPAKLSLP